MAGYKHSFDSNVDYAYGRGVRDIGGRLENGVRNIAAAGNSLKQFRKASNQAKDSVVNLKEKLSDLADERWEAIFEGNTEKVARLDKKIKETTKSIDGLNKSIKQMPWDAAEKGLGSVVKGLVSLNTSILTIGFDFLIDSIKRVYELQERWTRAIGGFNMKMGGMTQNIKGATKAAVQWSSTIRSLTNGDINEGIEMFGEFSMAIGQVKTSLDFQKWGVEVARGFNLGGASAGKLALTLKNIGNSAGDATTFMGKNLVAAANAADTPVNLLAKDISESTAYLARFGKEGQKAFVGAAAYARKFGFSIKEIQKSVEGFDMFDEAAKTASKLNVAFGTVINSMDLMMEDDPAKRLEMIRQQFLAQGQTWDKLAPKQRRYFSETMKLTEDEAAAVLSNGENYQDFLAKRDKAEKNEISAKKTMEMQLRKTAQTMYAFGMAFDRITVAIANAIKPLLEVFGLAKSGGKTFTSFGQVMESITVTVEEFFNSLAKNEKWQDFMKELAHDLIRAGKALKEFVISGGAADLVGDIASGMKQFYIWVRDAGIMAAKVLKPLIPIFISLTKHLDLLVAGWAGLKVFNAAGGISGFSKGLGVLKGGGMAGSLGMAGMAGGLGYAAGGTGAGIGAGAGSLIGGLFGSPIIGGVIGGLAGKVADYIFGSSKVKTALETAHEELEQAIKREAKEREKFTDVLDIAKNKTETEDRNRAAKNAILKGLGDAAAKQQGKVIELNEMEAESLRSRANELTMFSKSTKISKDMLLSLRDGSKLTKEQLADLMTGSKNYEIELSKLRDTTKQQADLEMSRLQVSEVGQRKDALEAVTKLRDMELKQAQTELEDAGGKYDSSGVTENINRSKGTNAMLPPEANQMIRRVNAITMGISQKDIKRIELEEKINKLDMSNAKDQKDLQKAQTDFLRQSTMIQLRQSVMNGSDFLNFSQTPAEQSKSLDQRFQDYIQQNSQSLKGLYGEDNFKLIANTPNAVNVASPSRSSMLAPTTPQYMAPPANFANQGSSGQFPAQFTLVTDIHLDGEKVGSARSVQRGLVASGIRSIGSI